ncbi:hypothetical protein RND81_06G048300 [Saponaria officinalis]|uniref:Uncharacterized protein n=1 Tax=Saponaria officinalis TaxID=3572 RepID=A0AAW1K6P1_SAPOF
MEYKSLLNLKKRNYYLDKMRRLVVSRVDHDEYEPLDEFTCFIIFGPRHFKVELDECTYHFGVFCLDDVNQYSTKNTANIFEASRFEIINQYFVSRFVDVNQYHNDVYQDYNSGLGRFDDRDSHAQSRSSHHLSLQNTGQLFESALDRLGEPVVLVPVTIDKSQEK